MNTNRTNGGNRARLAMIWAALLLLACQLTQAQTYTILYSFQNSPDGDAPLGNLIADSAGNLYGTTESGGAKGEWGTVYKMAPDGTVTILYSFTDGSDGALPMGGVVMDAAGNLYGTTAGDLGFTKGTVFKLAPDGTFTVLHSFTGLSDGKVPFAGLVPDGMGGFYGATSQGGDASDGTIFRISTDGTQFKVLSDIGTTAPLIRDSAGNLYGTAGGGDFGLGEVFELDAAGNRTVVYSFGKSGAGDGRVPASGLTRDAAGNLYGTTQFGGSEQPPCPALEGCGMLFKIDPSGNETILFTFTGKRDGGQPVGGLILDSKGNLYGTATEGGKQCPDATCGMVFEISQAGKEKVLHAFTGAPTDGYLPMSTLLFRRGIFYGTTFFGGTSDHGTIFQIVPASATASAHAAKRKSK